MISLISEQDQKIIHFNECIGSAVAQDRSHQEYCEKFYWYLIDNIPGFDYTRLKHVFCAGWSRVVIDEPPKQLIGSHDDEYQNYFYCHSEHVTYQQIIYKYSDSNTVQSLQKVLLRHDSV